VRPRRGLPPCFLSGSDVRPTLRSRTRPRADRKTRQTTFRSGSSGGIDAAIGLRVRTGYATAVLLGGPTASPRVLARVRVSLVDLDDEDARQPYHVVSEQDEKRGMRLVRQTRDTATAEATRAIRQLMEQADQAGHRVRAAALVVGSDVDPATLRHPHIRAHALEGRLYREAVEAAASRCGLACEVLVEGEALPSAAVAVGKRPVEIKAATDAWGKALGPPWGAQEKAAALAAWVALARR